MIPIRIRLVADQAAAVVLELLLVLLGAWYYRRSARVVTSEAHWGRDRAIVSAVLIALSRPQWASLGA